MAAKSQKATEAEAIEKEEVVGEETVEKAETPAVIENELVTNDDEEYDLSSLGLDEFELDGLSGLDTINASDIRVPYAKMYSKATNGREVGDIELVDGTVIKGLQGEVLEGLSILKVQSVRVYFPETFKKSNTFICRSFDNKVGAPDGKYAGTPCATCEFSKFPEGGGSSPCREQVLLLCTLPDGVMFHFLVSGIGVGEFKRTFLSVEMMKGLRIVKRKLKRQILAALNLSMSVEMQETDFGQFPKPVIRVNKENPMVSNERLGLNIESYASYKEFEDEAVASAATFAQTEQGEHEQSEADTGVNAQMF